MDFDEFRAISSVGKILDTISPQGIHILEADGSLEDKWSKLNEDDRDKLLAAFEKVESGLKQLQEIAKTITGGKADGQ